MHVFSSLAWDKPLVGNSYRARWGNQTLISTISTRNCCQYGLLYCPNNPKIKLINSRDTSSSPSPAVLPHLTDSNTIFHSTDRSFIVPNSIGCVPFTCGKHLGLGADCGYHILLCFVVIISPSPPSQQSKPNKPERIYPVSAIHLLPSWRVILLF